MSQLVVEFPDYFDTYEGEISAKGYFADLTVTLDQRIYRPFFYDNVRLRQEVERELATGTPFVFEPNTVVLQTVDRQHIVEALEWLAQRGFVELTSMNTVGGT